MSFAMCILQEAETIRPFIKRNYRAGFSCVRDIWLVCVCVCFFIVLSDMFLVYNPYGVSGIVSSVAFALIAMNFFL